MEESKVRFHESNEGRETQQGFAGFEGNNVLLLIIAIFIGLMLFRGLDGLGYPGWLTIVITASPVVLISAYVFGLKQGKPKSYDIEIAEWLIIRLAKLNYFSPMQVEKMKLPWNEPVKDLPPSNTTPPPPPSNAKNR